MGYTSTFSVYDDATGAGLGKDPTAAYTGTDSLAAATRHFRCEEFNTLTLRAVLVAGTAPTSVEFLLETSEQGVGSLHGGAAADVSTWGVLPVVVNAAGSRTTQETVRQFVWATAASSDTSHPWVEEIAAKKFRVRCKRTGGDGTTRIRVDAVLSVR